MKSKLNLVKRNIAGDIILVPVGETSLKLNGLITLNEVGEFIWDNLENAEDDAAMTALVTGEYEVDPAVAAADVSEFLGKLRDLGVL